MKITKEKCTHFRNMHIQKTKNIAEVVEMCGIPGLKEFCTQMSELALSIDEITKSMERSNRQKLLGEER